MKRKTVKQFEYCGLGFPIILMNVPLITVRGIEVPDIDYNELQRNVLLALCNKPFPLTGNEVRFIRQYLEMTYTDFAKSFGVTHAIVIHWEKSQNFLAKITPSTELCIRLFVLDALKANNKLFRTILESLTTLNFSKSQNRDMVQNQKILSF